MYRRIVRRDVTGTATTQTHWTERPDWWKPIAGIVASLVVAGGLSAVLPPDAYATLLLAPFVLTGLVLALLSPAFVYLDKRHKRVGVPGNPLD